MKTEKQLIQELEYWKKLAKKRFTKYQHVELFAKHRKSKIDKSYERNKYYVNWRNALAVIKTLSFVLNENTKKIIV